MQRNHTLPAMNKATLAALVAILAPYRHEPITPAVMHLAYRLASKEAMQ